MTLLGGFACADDQGKVTVPLGSQRLLALLALRPRPVKRAWLAGTLWPDATEQRALACLRSALSRLDDGGRRAVEADGDELALAPGVVVDLWEVETTARAVVDGEIAGITDDVAATIAAFSTDLLPSWYEDWALIEAEKWRQRRLHALDALVAQLVAIGRFADATIAALAAIEADSLRESARAALIRVHLAEHNHSEAVRAYRIYRELLHVELGLEPSDVLTQLVAHAVRP